MTVSRAEAAGLVGAIVAHAVVLAWMGRGAAPAAVHVPEATEETSADLELETLEPAPAPDTPEPAGAAVPLPAAVAIARATSPARSAPAAPADGVAPPATTAPDAPLDLRAPLTLSADALGLGGRNVFLGALPDGASAPPAADGPTANVAPGVQQSLRDALHERDHGIGLDIGGPIIAVAEELTRPSSTPLNSRAVFQVVADANGDVTSVSLVDVSQGRTEWERVATSLREALRSRKLHVPGGTGGVSITLEVASRWQLPSGHDPDMEVSVLGIPVKKAPKESKQPQRIEILKPELKIVEAPASPETATGVRLPQYQIQVKLLDIDVDPTDLTPRPLRVVHARVVREKLL